MRSRSNAILGIRFQHTAARRRLVPYQDSNIEVRGFNTQPPEGGWRGIRRCLNCQLVSTHSRPKAAGHAYPKAYPKGTVSTHSRPKAAGRLDNSCALLHMLFQHTAARRRLDKQPSTSGSVVCFNTQPPEGGWLDRGDIGCGG